MLAGDDHLGSVVLVLVAGDATVDGLLDDGDLVLVGARDARLLAAGVDAHGGVLDVGVGVQVADVHLPDVQGTGSVAPLAVDGPEAEGVDFDLPALVADRFLVDQRQQEVQGG